MYSSDKYFVTTVDGVNCSKGDYFSDVGKLDDSIEDAKDAKDLVKSLNKLSLYHRKWDILKDKNDETVFVSKDKHGNVNYLKASKNFSKTSSFGYTKVSLTNKGNDNFALSNEFKDAEDFKKALKDCNTAKDAEKLANKYHLYKYQWKVDRDKNDKVRLTTQDKNGNEYYLNLVKESFDKVCIPDLSDTPMAPSGVGGGLPVRWTYSQFGHFLSVYGIRNHINLIFNLQSKVDIENKMNIVYSLRDKGLCDNIDIQELEERLRLYNSLDVVMDSEKQSKVALEESVKHKKGSVYYTYDETGKKIKHIARGPFKTPTSAQKEAASNARKYAHTPEAEKKRRKTISARADSKELGI